MRFDALVRITRGQFLTGALAAFSAALVETLPFIPLVQTPIERVMLVDPQARVDLFTSLLRVDLASVSIRMEVA